MRHRAGALWPSAAAWGCAEGPKPCQSRVLHSRGWRGRSLCRPGPHWPRLRECALPSLPATGLPAAVLEQHLLGRRRPSHPTKTATSASLAHESRGGCGPHGAEPACRTDSSGSSEFGLVGLFQLGHMSILWSRPPPFSATHLCPSLPCSGSESQRKTRLH